MPKTNRFKIILLGIILVLIGINVTGQSWSQFGLTSLNPYRDFSAYGGMDRSTTILGHIRSQWSQFAGSPSTQYVGVHSPVYIWNGAVGLDIMNQSQGNFSLKRIRASYNAVLSSSFGLISVGGRLGVAQGSLNGENILTPEGDYGDGAINHNDPVLINNQGSGFVPTYELSSFIISSKWSLGVSISDFLPTELKVEEGHLGLNSQINLYFNFLTPLTYNIELQTTILGRSDFVNFQTEINSIAKINGNIFGGILLRGYSSSSIDAMGIIFGHSLNDKISIFYSYDFGLSDLKIAHQGSHELLLKYRLNKLFGTGLPPKVTYNPRFL